MRLILSSIHAGSLRYYGGRATLRFDILDPAWLDDAVAWLDDHGRHPYVLVEDWEMDLFRKRFAAHSRLGDLQAAPALAYRAYRMSTTVYLFDLLGRTGRRSRRCLSRIRNRSVPAPHRRPRFSG
jgi:hypothetical protein